MFLFNCMELVIWEMASFRRMTSAALSVVFIFRDIVILMLVVMRVGVLLMLLFIMVIFKFLV